MSRNERGTGEEMHGKERWKIIWICKRDWNNVVAPVHTTMCGGLHLSALVASTLALTNEEYV
jgi:hypothetical protein